jgi:hypothetical protein
LQAFSSPLVIAVGAVGILAGFSDGLSSLSVYPSAGATVMHQVNQRELDRAAYALAKEFLLQSGAGEGVTPELIEKYLHLDPTPWQPSMSTYWSRHRVPI